MVMDFSTADFSIWLKDMVKLFMVEKVMVEKSKGQLISKCLFEKIVWTKIATKKFDNFCPSGQIKKIKALSYINYGIFNVIKCLYFLI